MDTSDEADFLTEACHYMEYLDFENGQNHECHVLESHHEKERTKEAAKSLLEGAIRAQQEERSSPSKHGKVHEASEQQPSWKQREARER